MLFQINPIQDGLRFHQQRMEGYKLTIWIRHDYSLQLSLENDLTQ